ncbi:MAG: efflux RND transporter periplasmic adaptor subunit [Gammaproteobacteria bacterium]
MKTSILLRWVAAGFTLAAFAAAGILLIRNGNGEFPGLEPSAPVHSAGPFRIQVSIDPKKPRIGKNRITVVIRSPENQPVSVAAVTAIAEMPAMGAMPAMTAPAEMHSASAGVYRGEFELPMDGAWPLTLKIESRSGEFAELKFDMATSRRGLRLNAAGTDSPKEGNPSNSGTPGLPEQPKIFQVDVHRRQLIGVKTGVVQRKQLTRVIRAPGNVTMDETLKSDVSLKFDGWIGKLSADYVGAQVRKGRTLFTVYSPELVSAQDEYLESLQRTRSGSRRLQEAARRRLALWDVSDEQIGALEHRGKAFEYLPIPSPVTGTVIEKNIVAGSAVKAGQRLLRIADLSMVWVEGQLYESELFGVRAGMDAEVMLPDFPGRSFAAKVTFVEPFLQGDTRTAKVRVELANFQGILRPDAYARIKLKVDLGERLLVPEEAVIHAGESRIVFVDLGGGRLEPRKIETGLRNQDWIEVRSGLRAGDVVITSGNFLIASESKLKAGLDAW